MLYMFVHGYSPTQSKHKNNQGSARQNIWHYFTLFALHHKHLESPGRPIALCGVGYTVLPTPFLRCAKVDVDVISLLWMALEVLENKGANMANFKQLWALGLQRLSQTTHERL